MEIISNDTINMIFKEGINGWSYYHKHFGHGFYKYSPPVFFKNYTYCIIYQTVNCGGLYGGGDAMLFTKENGKWKLIRSENMWVS